MSVPVPACSEARTDRSRRRIFEHIDPMGKSFFSRNSFKAVERHPDLDHANQNNREAPRRSGSFFAFEKEPHMWSISRAFLTYKTRGDEGGLRSAYLKNVHKAYKESLSMVDFSNCSSSEPRADRSRRRNFEHIDPIQSC